MNREIFSLAWAESAVYVTSARVLRGQKRTYYVLYFRLDVLRLACWNGEILYAKLLAFSNLEKHTDALRIKLFFIKHIQMKMQKQFLNCMRQSVGLIIKFIPIIYKSILIHR